MENLNNALPQWIKDKIVYTGKFCNIHENEEMVILPFQNHSCCPICEQKANREREDAKLVAEVLNNQKKVKHAVLRRESVIQDNTIANATFENYEAAGMAEILHLKQAKELLNKIMQGPPEKYFLQGKAGTGKSHLSMAIAKEYINSDFGKSAVFIDIAKMFELIMAGFKAGEGYKYTQDYFTTLAETADLFVLDDLGAESGNVKTDKQATDFKAGVLRSIFNARQGKNMIVTTNLSVDELINLYGDERLISRIFSGNKKENNIIFKNGKDRRAANIFDLGF